MTDRLTGVEVTELQGQATDPPVSAPGDARVYYNTTSGVRRMSANGSAYANLDGVVQPHDTTHSPVGLWQFDEDLTDSSGNGFDLIIAGGSEHYTQLLPGLNGFLFDSFTYLQRGPATPALVILGDLTIECIVLQPAIGFQRVLVQHGVSGSEVEADNVVYTMTFADIGWSYLAEQGAGVDIAYSELLIGQPMLLPMHVAMVRSSNQVQFYLQGRPSGSPSAGLAAPTGGGNGRLYVGGDASGSFVPPRYTTYSSLKIVDGALSAADIRGEYNRTLGPLLGRAP